MPRTRRILVASLLAAAPLAHAQPAAPATSQPSPLPLAPKPVGILADRPDADQPSELLGPRFESRMAGISFRPPAGCKEAKPGSDEIVEYVNEPQNRLLRVSRPTFPTPVPLLSKKDTAGKVLQQGLLDYTIDQLKIAYPGAKFLRQPDDIINVGPHFVGLIAMRFTLGSQKWLRQQAMFQVNEQLYYVLNLTTPAGNVAPNLKPGEEDNTPPDPLEKQAVETFSALVDSVKILDRTEIKEDQNNRLFRTRALFLNWTPQKLSDALLGKQYFRILRDGKDVGYTYVEEAVEDQAIGGVGLKGAAAYTRTHLIDADPKGRAKVADTASFKFMAFDRRHETWTRVVVLQADTDKGPTETHTSEFGDSQWDTKKVWAPQSGVYEKEDRNVAAAPRMRPVEVHALDVSIQGKEGTPEPLHMDLPPFYLPQAGGHLLPRLVIDKSYHEPRTYLFATYVPETRDLRMHYVDVSEEREVMFAGRKVLAYVVSERLGLEGTPTRHYVTADCKYLGSETPVLKTMVLPSDEATVLKLWPKAKLTRPEKLQHDAKPAPAADATVPGDPAPTRGLPPAIR
jgi:hypothetical protein